MSKSSIFYAIVGLFAGFFIGFAVANTVSRGGRGEIRAELMRSPAGAPGANAAESAARADGSPPTLTEDEIREAIAKTDARPGDFSLQRHFGLALYRYANHTQNPGFLPDVARLLKRAYESGQKDRDLTVSIANVLFDIGQTSDPASFSEARVYYLKALEMEPNDVDVRTDLGLTYYLGRPSDPRRAIAEFRRSLAIDPRHEPALQHLAAALISAGEYDEGRRRIDELRSVNPSNTALPDLRAQLAQGKNAARE